MFLILEGEGELRFGDQRYPIRKHDVIACPQGGPEVAHQIINTGTTTLRYLALSTMSEVDTCEYPGFRQDPDRHRPERGSGVHRCFARRTRSTTTIGSHPDPRQNFARSVEPSGARPRLTWSSMRCRVSSLRRADEIRRIAI